MNEINRLNEARPADDAAGELGALRVRERVLVSAALLLVLALAALDLIEDAAQGQDRWRLLGDAAYLGLMVAVLAYLWRHVPSTTRRQNLALTREIVSAHRDLASWRERATALIAGLREVVDQQFDLWKLSAAEKEVALLLVKGLSLKEIAALRETSERTVRQQASVVYAKSKLGGRAELAAFFLEDLLSPQRDRDDTG